MPRHRGPSRDSEAQLAPRERLLFEAGVKLGGIFHQYLGIPVSRKTSTRLARTIESAVRLQPFVTDVKVRIDVRRAGRPGPGRFAYHYLRPEMLKVRLTLAHDGSQVRARLEYRRDLRYPLMSVLADSGLSRPSRRGPVSRAGVRPGRSRVRPVPQSARRRGRRARRS